MVTNVSFIEKFPSELNIKRTVLDVSFTERFHCTPNVYWPIIKYCNEIATIFHGIFKGSIVDHSFSILVLSIFSYQTFKITVRYIQGQVFIETTTELLIW